MEQLCFGIIAWFIVFLVWGKVADKQKGEYVCDDCMGKKTGKRHG